MAVCAKQMKPGDIAWRCLDCEKDPTCIICKECFEKSDHTGHRIQLKRNVGGCCDCGDPEAWDEKHFCSDHKGQQAFDPQQVLNNLPRKILDSASIVFNVICKQLKLIQMKLQNYEELCLSEEMSSDTYKNTQVQCIKMIFQFITDRIDECPSFIHIVDEALTQIYFDVEIFQKNQEHQTCCFRQYNDKDKAELNKLYNILQNNEKLYVNFCSCSALDLSMQTNHFLNDESRKIIHDLFFKLFQSFLFKQRLAYSFAANYEKLMSYKSSDKDHISVIGVQILTSDELSMIIFKNEELWVNMLQCFTNKCIEFSKDFENLNLYYYLNEIIHDFKYMARPESLKYCIENTDFIEKLLKSLKYLYFIDSKKQRDTMIEFAPDINTWLLNIEIYLVKVVHLYLKEIPVSDKQKNQSILQAFFQTFAEIDSYLKDKKLQEDGFISLPLHRSFCYYFSRLLFCNYFQDSSINKNLSIQDKFVQILDSNLDKNFNQISSLISDDENENSQHYDIIQNFKNILLTQIKSISFIHEVLSRKWVYHGYQFEHFPHVYYKLSDRMSYQDLCTFQILLSFDYMKVNQNQAGLFDFLIDNFGLDGQLKFFIDNLKKYKISEKCFLDKWPKFDVQKLKQQILMFLRFLIQICTYEVSYMKQLYNRREEIVEASNHHIKTTNHAQIQQLWSHVLEKEAVHLLLLNKINTNIVVIKENMNEIYIKDQLFEEALFKVSDQARDIKNQVTFKIKDEYVPWWDPFQYIAPDQYSLAYQMYDQNGLKDKLLKEGLNDVVGDYLDNYTFTTEINEQLIFNMSRSSLIKIICPLLCIFLYQEENQKDHQEKDIKEIKEIPIDKNIQTSNLNSAQILTQIAVKTAFMSQFNQYQNFDEELNMFQNSSQQQIYFNKLDEEYLKEIVDANIGNHCIKLFIIIIKSFTSNKIQDKISIIEKNNFIKEISLFDNKLAKSFIQCRNQLIQKQQQEQSKIEIKKILKIYTFILDLIYKLDPKIFLFVGQSLGYVYIEQNNNINEEQDQQDQIKVQNSDQNIDNAQIKKDLLKKKQSKLISKMKLKSQQLLNKNNVNSNNSNLNGNNNILSEEKIQEENINCAFCQEELTRINFLENPFGNFGFVQSSSVLYHAIKQTSENQENAFKNADYSLQFGDQQQSSFVEQKFIEEEKKQSSLIDSSSQQIDIENFKQKNSSFQEKLDQDMEDNSKQKIDFQHICQFLNKSNGSGTVITNCMHYSHLNCAQKYQKEQLTTIGQFYQHRQNGFNDEEFSCPICKTLTNTLLPLFSYDDIVHKVPKLQDNQVMTYENLKSTIDFYMNLFSKIILSQQGVVTIDDEEKYDLSILSLKQNIGFSDIKSNSTRVIAHSINFIIHNICLIDLKGLPQFQSAIQKLSVLHSSLGSILKQAFKGNNLVLKFFKQELSFKKTIEINTIQLIEKLKVNIFSQNIQVSTLQILFLFSFLKVDEKDQQTQQSNFQKLMNIIQIFYPILRIQIAIAAYFRQQDGSIKKTLHNQQENVINSKNLDQLNQTEDFQNITVEIELSVMRKIYAAVQILKIIYFSQYSDENTQTILHNFKQVCQKGSNQEELDAIIQELNLKEQRMETFEKIFEENQTPIFLQQDLDENQKINQIFLHFKFIRSSLFLKDSFSQYINNLNEQPDQQKNILYDNKIKMPHLLMTMTPYVTFDFYDIPNNFMNLQTQYYKRNCCICKSNSLDSATCLLCGETFCWFKNKCQQNSNSLEGLLTQHTKEKEGGQAVFLHTSSGGIILMSGGNSCIVDTPYRNKYGELISEADKRYDQYVIDSQGGGYEALQLIRKRFINFQTANDIIQQRTNPDNRYKVYQRNVL